MHNRCRAGAIKTVQIRHRQMQRKESIERQRWNLAVECNAMCRRALTSSKYICCGIVRARTVRGKLGGSADDLFLELRWTCLLVDPMLAHVSLVSPPAAPADNETPHARLHRW
jgi:hypothetical protein